MASDNPKGLEPPPILFKEQPFDLDFHPNKPYVGIGLITGSAFVYEYGESQNVRLMRLKHHTESCRSIRFSPNGTSLLTASADRSIRRFDLQSGGAPAGSMLNAHDNGVSRIFFIGDNLLVSGDDEGEIKVWDVRQGSCAFSFNENDDFISDFAYNAEKDMLLATSGDGTLAVYNLRQRQLEAMSDNQEDELLSVVLLKDGKKVVCGSQEGILNIFSWGNFGDISDRFPGHPQSIDTIAVVDQNTICTGSSDGLVRIVSIHPNKLLGVVGEHGEFPIERIALSTHSEAKILGSCSHDNSIRFWNVTYLYEDRDNGAIPDATAAVAGQASGGDMDMDAEPMDGGSDDDSDESDAMAEDRPAGRKKNARGQSTSKDLGQGPGTDFFKDL